MKPLFNLHQIFSRKFNPRRDQQEKTASDGIVHHDGISYRTDASRRIAAVVSASPDIRKAALRQSVVSGGVPHKVTYIDKEAFANCGNLVQISIPYSVESVGDRAFAGCKALSVITLTEMLHEIGAGAFDGCNGLTAIFMSTDMPPETVAAAFPDTVLSTCSLFVPPASVVRYREHPIWMRFRNIGAAVAVIGGLRYRFSEESGKVVVELIEAGDGCSYSGDVAVADTLTFAGITCSVKVAAEAFRDCTDLRTITLPASQGVLGFNTFKNCTSLEGSDISGATGWIGKGAFYNCISLREISIPVGVKTIEESAFYRCGSLETVSGATNNVPLWIAANCFAYCSRLRKIDLPIKQIGAHAFYMCRGLESVVCQARMQEAIGEEAFSHCEKLADVVFESQISAMESRIFSNCTSLKNITLHGNMKPPVVSVDTFTDYQYEEVTLYVPAGCVENYKKVDIWRNFRDIREIPISESFRIGGLCYRMLPDENFALEVVASDAQVGYYGNIMIPASVNFGGQAFSVKSVGEKAFADCKNLIRVELREGVTRICPQAFRGCSKLVEVVLPETITEIGTDAFARCDKLDKDKLRINMDS